MITKTIDKKENSINTGKMTVLFKVELIVCVITLWRFEILHKSLTVLCHVNAITVMCISSCSAINCYYLHLWSQNIIMATNTNIHVLPYKTVYGKYVGR